VQSVGLLAPDPNPGPFSGNLCNLLFCEHVRVKLFLA